MRKRKKEKSKAGKTKRARKKGRKEGKGKKRTKKQKTDKEQNEKSRKLFAATRLTLGFLGTNSFTFIIVKNYILTKEFYVCMAVSSPNPGLSVRPSS